MMALEVEVQLDLLRACSGLRHMHRKISSGVNEGPSGVSSLQLSCFNLRSIASRKLHSLALLASDGLPGINRGKDHLYLYTNSGAIDNSFMMSTVV